MREEGWYWVQLPTPGPTGWSPGPWTCMEWESVGWWFEEIDGHLEDKDLYNIDERRILDPDERG